MADLFAYNAAGFDDPLAMLYACHDRMRRQLDTLERLCRHLPIHGADAEARRAARNILKYFDTAAPNHHADEEQSLCPRLAAAGGDAAPELIDKLNAEHHELTALWRELRPYLAAIAAGMRSVLPPALVRRVRGAYLAHLEMEETELLPFAARRLNPATLETIGREMARRRGVAMPQDVPHTAPLQRGLPGASP